MAIDQDYNTLKTNGFTFVLQRIPETVFRVTACNLPAITVPPPDENVPGITQYWAGTYTEFDEITLRFTVDEDMKAYEELYDWITLNRFADNPGIVPEEDLYSDGTLITMTNNSNSNRIFEFKAMQPIALGELSFDTTMNPVPVTCSVTFRYSHFKMVKRAKKTAI